IRNIADVSGAGDTVIAVAALVYAARKNVHLMAELVRLKPICRRFISYSSPAINGGATGENE
ncbi:MAG: hypothetical protein EOP49_32710, partial [Sphingobacteriales bacterium]